MAEQQQGGRNPKRPRVEADKRRDALLHVQDEYADIDFTKYQKLVGAGAACVATDGSVGGGDGSDGGGGATPRHFPQPARDQFAWFRRSHEALWHAACWVVSRKWAAFRRRAGKRRQCHCANV